MNIITKQVKGLTDADLMRLAPSIFAEHRHLDRTSERYTFVPSTDVLAGLRGAGWFPVKAAENRVRKADRKGFQSHMIRFRRDTNLLDVGDIIPELVLRNSHDGVSAYVFEAGLFRCVCKNQMTVADSLFQRISVKHVGLTSSDIIEASYRVLDDLPKVIDSAQAMKALTLTRDEQLAFATQALVVKYGENDGQGGVTVNAPIAADKLLTVRREADKAPTLWNTFNAVQENVIRGGIRPDRPAGAKRRPSKTRAVTSITEDIRLNKALWALGEEMKRLKVAA